MFYTKCPDVTLAATESVKYRHLVEKYCYRDGVPGCGIDMGSQGLPFVDWAMGIDLPADQFAAYCGGVPPKGPIQIRCSAASLPFDSDSLDFVYSSHLLEDFLDWTPILREWVRVLRPGGHLITIVPDKDRWYESQLHGQMGNPWHKHESRVGELSEYANAIGVKAIEDRFTEQWPGDYSILFVGQKLAAAKWA